MDSPKPAYPVVSAHGVKRTLADGKELIDGRNECLYQLLRPSMKLPYVRGVRVLGAIGVIQVTQAVVLGIMQKIFVEDGVRVRRFGNLVYVMPPYVMSPKDLALLCKGILKVLALYFGQNHVIN